MVPLLSAVALIAALISAVAGVGGGTILIAAMFAVGLSPVVAIPVHAAVQLVSNAARAVAYRPHLDWRAAAWFCVGALPLPFLFAPLVARADADVVRLLLAGFILISLAPRGRLRLQLSLRSRMLIAGALNGSLGMIVGATGLVIAPFFLHPEWRKETTVGTLALCQSFGHAGKIAAFATVGTHLLDQLGLLLPLALAVVCGTALGRWLMYRVSQSQFLLLFRLLLAALALRLMWTGVVGLGLL